MQAPSEFMSARASGMELNMKKKSTYAAPRLTRHGSVEALTKGGATGSFIDAAFSAGTPIADLTFS